MGNLVLLPMGCIEEHGLLPPETDTLIARAFCELCADRLQAIVLEPIEEGYCPATCELEGTKVFDFQTIFEKVKDRLATLITKHTQGIILINIHKGNDPALIAALQDIYIQHKRSLFYFNPYIAFAKELNADCFSDGDNGFKECSLLHASLEILEIPPLSGPEQDQDFQRDLCIEYLKKFGVPGYSYTKPEQHVPWRSNANAAMGRKFLEATVNKFIPVAIRYKELVEREIENNK